MSEKNQVTQWEYKYVNADLSKLNEIGKEGWEATGNSNTNGILVKRPIKKETKEPDYGYSR